MKTLGDGSQPIQMDMRDSMKKDIKWYKQWPVIILFVWILMVIAGFIVDKKAGLVISAFWMAYLIVILILYFHDKTLLISGIGSFGEKYGFMHNALLMDLKAPYAVMLDDGKIIWANEAFNQIFAEDSMVNRYLSNYIHDLNRSVFPKEKDIQMEVQFGNHDFNAILSRVDAESIGEAGVVLGLPKGKEFFVTVMLEDVTDLHYYIRENEGQKLVSGLIYFDNYEEVMESVWKRFGSHQYW